MNRRRFVGSGLYSIFMPFIAGGRAAAPPIDPIVLAPPPGISVHAENTQAIRDYAGVIFAATRANSSIGGVVWRVDGYVSPQQQGTATYVLNDPAHAEPEKFFGNGELIVWPDGYLYYVTVQVDSIEATRRNVIAIVPYPVPGWSPWP